MNARELEILESGSAKERGESKEQAAREQQEDSKKEVGLLI